jgi:AraC-like DNA-binding protein
MKGSGHEVECAGRALGKHRHICAFFNSVDEEHRVLGSFIRDGLDRGERAIHLVDTELRGEYLKGLADAGIDVQQALSTLQLQVLPYPDAYLREDRFDQEAMLALLEDLLQSSATSGYPLARVLGHMEWALLEKPGVEDLIEYETRLNYLLPKYDDPVVCCYDLTKFSTSMIMDVMRTHPVAIIGGVLQENPFFVPPDEFLRELRKRRAQVIATSPSDIAVSFEQPVSRAIGTRIRHTLAESSHTDDIARVLQGRNRDPVVDEVSDSWRRSQTQYHVELDSHSAPNVLTEREVTNRREPLSSLILHAQEEVDRLYSIVREAGYVVLLCDTEGIAVDHRGQEAMADQFAYWGTWLGGVWSEQVEGTNGIGTCIVEERPTSVHLGQHYRTRHTALSCAGAPIFNPSGGLAAVLDSSSINAQVSDHAHALTLAATVTAARAIEERLFRESFRQSWVLAAMPCDEGSAAVLLALDRDQHVVGADRSARTAFALDDASLNRRPHLQTLFDYVRSIFRREGERHDAVVRLIDGRGQSWQALITPPEAPGRWCGREEAAYHARPRVSLRSSISMPSGEARDRGGLSPRVMRRVCEYLDTHLDEQITLDSLSRVAGLSLHHFARAFRQSLGQPPHHYILRRRIERAEQMLKESNLPLSQIALAVGFADHSHFARHFRRLVGVSPGVARWNLR